MNLSAAVTRRMEEYLRAVENNLSAKPPAVRREVVAELRNHILEALRRQGGAEPTSAGLEAVLADMDAPECFAESAAPAPMPASVPLARPAVSHQWEIALVILLAFLAGYGLAWWQTRAPTVATPVVVTAVADTNVVAEVSPLLLRQVDQINLTAAREVTLRLLFNATPDRESLVRLLRLAGPENTEVSYDLLGQAGSNVVLIKTASVPFDQVELRLAAGLGSRDPAFAPGIEQSASLAVRSEFQFRSLDAVSPPFASAQISVLFNALPEENGLAEQVSVEPPVRFTVERLDSWQGSGLTLSGDFEPGAVYTVTLAPGLTAENGNALGETIRRVVQMPNRPAALSFANEGRYLSPRGKLLVPVMSMNLDHCEVQLAPVFANNLVQLAHRDAGSYSFYGALTEQLEGRAHYVSNAIFASPNQVAETRLDLRALAGPEPRGVYWLSIGHDKVNGDSRLVVVTDLGLVARVSPQAVLVWVNSLREARPVAACEVVLYGANNQEIGRGRTDERGLVQIARSSGDEPFVITAQKDGDLSYVDLARTEVSQGHKVDGAAYLGPDEAEAAVFTERGVYRPGETVFMQALVRDRTLQAPKSFPALFRIRKPDGRIYKDVPVTLDDLGSARAEAVLPDFLPTGRYTLELALPGTFSVLGQTVVSLEDFVPPQIRVDLEPPAGRLTAGAELAYRVKSEHLFGRAASGLKANGFVTFRMEDFAPAAWKDWHFGDGEKRFSPVYRQLGTQVLDEEGRAEFSTESSAAWRPPAALLAVQQAVVTEASGRTVTSYGSTPVDVYPFYIGLRVDREGTLRVGETQHVRVVEVKPDGTPAGEDKPLLVKLARVQWTSALKRNSNGRYEWKSERDITVIREDTLAASGAERMWPFAVDQTGEYLLLVSDPASGSSSSLRLNAASADQEWVAWSRENPDRVELALDRERYHAGDTARLLIKAPFSGTALLTVESDRVLEQRVITLEKNTAEVDLPVRLDYAPNVYAVVTLLRPAVAENVWSAHRAVGALALPVEPVDGRLQVSLDAPGTNRPQAALPVQITVRDGAGQPAKGAVTVMAVDEAICMLTGFETPDPLDTFLAQRGLGISLFDLYRELMPVLDEAVAGVSHIGGDGGAGLRRRLNPIKANRFKPVALWQAGVNLDAEGRATVQLPVPEFSGELRLMAVAYNGRQSGVAAQPVKVKRNLVVQPSLPRFLATGDRCQALVDIFNESGKPADLRLRVTCGGPLQAEVAEQQIALKAGESRQVQVPMVAGDVPGKALCTFEVTGGAETYRDTLDLAVRPASGLQVHAQFIRLAAGESVDLAPPASWVPGSVAQDLVVAREPALQLGRALDYVMHYPYGCLEQTVSGAFPLLYAADLAERILPASAARTDLADFVQAGVLRVLSMQQSDGSFALWPFERATDRANSLYAIHFLVEARKAAYPVPVDRLDAALGWLRERLDREVITDASPGNTAWADDLQERAYACYVLALAGRPDHGWNARLREQAARLRFAARVHVAGALLLSGEPRQATALLAELGMPAERPRELGGLLNSEVRDAALLLGAWLEIEPGNEAVARLVQLLDQRQRDGHWGTTQDNAMALLALGKYAQRVPADKRPFTGTLFLSDGLTRSLNSDQAFRLATAPGDVTVRRLENRGPGTMYAVVRFEGVSDAVEPDVDRGLSVRRDYLDINGQPLDVAALEQGALVIVRLAVDTGGRALDQIAVEELLPAGWEIENPNLATAQQFSWITEKSDWCRARELRDDRMLLFTGALQGRRSFYYAARAVTPGLYVYPPVTAACMYEPEIRSVQGGREVSVTP